MKFSALPVLADENIHPEVVAFLQQKSFDVFSTSGSLLAGKSDLELLEFAFSTNRIILTQDSDFGKLIFTQDIPFIGIVFLRPGHFEASFHIVTLKAIIETALELKPPFILVGENNLTDVRLRLRQM